MGKVYEAQDLRLGRTVALKVLNDIGSTDGTEPLREARAAAAFEHPSAVVVLDVGVETTRR
jgi:serine/threonine-protein kinase